MRKSLLALLVASFAVTLTAGPAAAGPGKYCANSQSTVLVELSGYCG